MNFIYLLWDNIKLYNLLVFEIINIRKPHIYFYPKKSKNFDKFIINLLYIEVKNEDENQQKDKDNNYLILLKQKDEKILKLKKNNTDYLNEINKLEQYIKELKNQKEKDDTQRNNELSKKRRRVKKRIKEIEN